MTAGPAAKRDTPAGGGAAHACGRGTSLAFLPSPSPTSSLPPPLLVGAAMVPGGPTRTFVVGSRHCRVSPPRLPLRPPAVAAPTPTTATESLDIGHHRRRYDRWPPTSPHVAVAGVLATVRSADPTACCAWWAGCRRLCFSRSCLPPQHACVVSGASHARSHRCRPRHRQPCGVKER